MNKFTSHALEATFPFEVVDHHGKTRSVRIAGEVPLTIKVDGRELVTLMTLGTCPEDLVVGYLYNQRFIESADSVKKVKVNWEQELAEVTLAADHAIEDWQEKLKKRVVTSGCGQGTVFSCSLEKLYGRRLPDRVVAQSTLYALLDNITQFNEVYKSSGAVHGCALCQDDRIIDFIEDVGRHNAADAIAGRMLMQDIKGDDKIFYTTGRLTSEIIMKAVNMNIPTVLSRSGVTYMGMELAGDLNVTLVARAKGRSFLIYVNPHNVIFDVAEKT